MHSIYLLIILVPLVIFDTFCFVCKRRRVCVTYFIVSYMTRKALFTLEFRQLDCNFYKLHLYYVHKILCSSQLGYVWFTFDFVLIGALRCQVLFGSVQFKLEKTSWNIYFCEQFILDIIMFALYEVLSMVSSK